MVGAWPTVRSVEGDYFSSLCSTSFLRSVLRFRPSHSAALDWLLSALAITTSSSGFSTTLHQHLVHAVRLGAAQVAEIAFQAGAHAVLDLFLAHASCLFGLLLRSLLPRRRRQAVAMRAASASKNAATARQLRAAVLDRVHARAELLAAGQAAHVPADVLARAAHAGELAVQRVVVLQVVQQQAAHLGHQRRRQRARRWPGSARSRGRSTGRPCAARPIITASAPVAASTSRAFSGDVDVAVGHHRDAHRGLHRGDGVVLGVALVALLARAAVHGEHLHAGGLEGARQRTALRWSALQPVRIFSVTGTPCGAQAATTACGDRERQRLVLHQRRAGPLVADLLGRAAHVDVDDLRAAVDVVGAPPRPSWPRRCRRSAPRSGPARPRGWRGARS